MKPHELRGATGGAGAERSAAEQREMENSMPCGGYIRARKLPVKLGGDDLVWEPRAVGRCSLSWSVCCYLWASLDTKPLRRSASTRVASLGVALSSARSVSMARLDLDAHFRRSASTSVAPAGVRRTMVPLCVPLGDSFQSPSGPATCMCACMHVEWMEGGMYGKQPRNLPDGGVLFPESRLTPRRSPTSHQRRGAAVCDCVPICACDSSKRSRAPRWAPSKRSPDDGSFFCGV